MLDSLYRLVNNHPEEDSIRVKLLYHICHYQQSVRLEKNLALANEALQISKRIHFVIGEASAHRYLAHYYRLTGDYYRAEVHAREMADVSERGSYIRGRGLACQILGQIAEENGNWKKAKENYLNALDIFIPAKSARDISAAFMSLGTLSLSTEQYDDALNYLLKAQEYYPMHDTDLGSYHNNLGIVYMNRKQYDLAREYFDKALDTAEKFDHHFLRSAVSISLGDLLTRTGHYADAEKYLRLSIVSSREAGNKRLLSLAYQGLADIEKLKGHFARALEYYVLKDQYKDSVYTQENAQRIAMMETRFESERKDKLIVELNSQQQLHQVRQKYAIIGLGVLSMLFVGFCLLQRSHIRKTRQLLKAQQVLNDTLREMDKMKSRFFANISHEFRTPLSLILAPVEEELAAKKGTDSSSLSLIRRNAQRLLTLVNQIMDLSKLEAQKMKLLIRKGNLKEMITIVCTSFDSLAAARGIHFKKAISLDETWTWFDADKLEKILNNLLINAFKFTPAEGVVTIEASLTETNRCLKISVRDTGIGITPEDQPHIFSPFFQSQRARSESEGSGLGLALVKELVALHGGSLQFESSANSGTMFHFTLPITPEAFKKDDMANEIINSVISPLPDLLPGYEEESVPDDSFEDSVLIVEDNADLRNYIGSLLEDSYTILKAADGNEGFELATNNVPSLVLSDVMMPGMNGITLAEKIKHDERTSHIPVVLLTARVNDYFKIEGLETGADDYLSKPFSTQELKIRIRNLIDQRKKLALRYRNQFSSPSHTISAEPKIMSLDERFLIKVKTVIEEHIGDSHFGVEALAEEIGLSRAQLFRKLKAICGLSPNELINEIRLVRASELIRAKADNFAQISYDVGYNEPSYFARRFRQKFGVSPKEYQANFDR